MSLSISPSSPSSPSSPPSPSLLSNAQNSTGFVTWRSRQDSNLEEIAMVQKKQQICLPKLNLNLETAFQGAMGVEPIDDNAATHLIRSALGEGPAF